MTKQQKQQFDNLYNFSNNVINQKSEDKNEKKKVKEREKRIQEIKNQKKEQFDFDTETVIGMTKKNNKNKIQESQKRLTKKQSQILKKKKRIKRTIRWTTLFLIIIGGIIFALVSPIFNIEDIQIVNNTQIATKTIISLSGLEKGQNLFRFSFQKVEKDIKTEPYIENVNIKRKIPNKVQIIVEERQRDYNVEFLNGYAYINKQGYILEVSEQKLDLPVIQGIETEQEQIVAGNRLNNNDLEKLETVIQIMNICKNYELEEKVTNIDITDKNSYIIYMQEEKKTIYLGDATNLNNKMLYVPTVLEENKGKEGNIYIDKDINTVNRFKARFREKV